jgi:hypothetical protein
MNNHVKSATVKSAATKARVSAAALMKLFKQYRVESNAKSKEVKKS